MQRSGGGECVKVRTRASAAWEEGECTQDWEETSVHRTGRGCKGGEESKCAVLEEGSMPRTGGGERSHPADFSWQGVSREAQLHPKVERCPLSYFLTEIWK